MQIWKTKSCRNGERWAEKFENWTKTQHLLNRKSVLYEKSSEKWTITEKVPLFQMNLIPKKNILTKFMINSDSRRCSCPAFTTDLFIRNIETILANFHDFLQPAKKSERNTKKNPDYSLITFSLSPLSLLDFFGVFLFFQAFITACVYSPYK